MPAPGPREGVFAAIAAQLAKVSVEGGYYNNVAKVFRTDLETAQINDGDMPALFVLDTLQGETMQFQDRRTYLSRLPLVIAGVVRVGGTDRALMSEAAHAAINLLVDDARKALTEDETFGGKCKDSLISNVFVFVDTDRNEALFNMSFSVQYYWTRGDL